MLKNVSDITSQDLSKGLNTISNIFNLSQDESPNLYNIKINFDGSIEKRLGSNLQNTTSIGGAGSSGFTLDSANTLTDGLVAFWKLNEPSGSREDSFGGHTLTDHNTVGFSDGIRGRSARFLTANSEALIHLNSSTIATGDVDFSLSTWFYLNSTGDYAIYTKRNAGEGNTNTVLLMHGSGSQGSSAFTDNSLSNHTIVGSGDVQIDSAQSAFGGTSIKFDGTGDYLNIADSADWDFGTGDFTIDFKVRFNSTTGAQRLITRADGGDFEIRKKDSNELEVSIEGTQVFSQTWSPPTSSFGHVALTRNGTDLRLFVDGVQQGGTVSNNSDIQGDSLVIIGAQTDGSSAFNGWMDEIRILKGEAAWTENFDIPTDEYANPSNASEYEYSLSVRTDNKVVFSVSSSGTATDGTIVADSIGAISTATWYNVVAWHDTGNFIGISVNLATNSASYSSGVRSGSAPLALGAVSNGANGLYLDGRVDESGFWSKVLTRQEREDLYNSGAASTYDGGFSGFTWGSFDFGANDKRWLMFAAGTGVYASSDLGVNFTSIVTDNTSTWTHFNRSGQFLIITNDVYDTPLKWDGSGGTFASILNASAPLAKFSNNHQGFTLLLNTNERKRGFYYEDVDSQITGDWAESFDLPSSEDDEITGSFVLGRSLYVPTRYKIFRLSYVGGNPDWSFTEVKQFGFVPRTVKKITLKDIGEVAVGMSWDRRIRLFDGRDDRIISDNVENDNKICEFALKKVSYAGSGLQNYHSVLDENEQVYKLNVAIGENSDNTTDMLNLDGRNLAFYPDDNQQWQTMVMAESANRKYLLAGDRSGCVFLLNSGNIDLAGSAGSANINDVFESPFIYDQSPSNVSKAHKIDLYLQATSSGRLYYDEVTDFMGAFKRRKEIALSDTGLTQIKEAIDIPVSYNTYRFRLSSSSGTTEPWKLNRTDYFTSGKGIGNNP